MESLYYVVSWLCHRKCVHCYDDRFRPYLRDDLAQVVGEAERCWPRIVDHLPAAMRYLDLASPLPEGGYQTRTGRIILAGGELLVDPIREPVLYPLLVRLREKYRSVGGVKVIVQTTGDLVTEPIVERLIERGVWMISVSGMDDFHVGMEGDKRRWLEERLTELFTRLGLRPSDHTPGADRPDDDAQPTFGFFGATPGSWIGKLWPRGRAWQNDLSSAGIVDNYP